jgi:ATP-dependent exoDNAse (exonuclease V) beta subunit
MGWHGFRQKLPEVLLTPADDLKTLLGEHADWPANQAAELPYLQAEEDRLLYVAATRAREVLVISRSTENLRNPAWGVLNKLLAQASELLIPSTANVPPVSPLDSSNALVTAGVGRQAAAHLVAVNPSWRTTSVTAEARYIARMAGFMKFSADDPSKVLAADSPSHRADAGQAWGTLIHGLLEHAMSQKKATAEDLQRLGMWLTVEEPQLRQVLELAVKTVLYVSKCDFWDEAKRSDCSVEAPFAFAESLLRSLLASSTFFSVTRGAGKSLTTRLTSILRSSCLPTKRSSRCMKGLWPVLAFKRSPAHYSLSEASANRDSLFSPDPLLLSSVGQTICVQGGGLGSISADAWC